jgi:hypothetical protein
VSAPNDGGPAFPNTGNSTWNLPPTEGMTLRDYFAAKAMQTMLTLEGGGGFDAVAHDAYEMAEAMLKARES